MQLLISPQLQCRVDSCSDPVAVFDGYLQAVYTNESWPSALIDLHDPDAAYTYLQDRYEVATLLQGVQEIIEGRQPLFTRKCQLRANAQNFTVQITVTKVSLLDGSSAAEVWIEQALGGSPLSLP